MNRIVSTLFLATLFAFFLAAVATAQQIFIPAGVDSTQSLIMGAIVVLTPVLIGLIKKQLYTVQVLADGSEVAIAPPWLEKNKWIMPFIPVLVAALLGYLAQLLPGFEGNVWVSFALGVLAVYVREVFKPLLALITGKATKSQILQATSYQEKVD